MARMKRKMNHGTDTLVFSPFFCLKINMETRERGMIHKALVSLIVVATFKASSPYMDAAPTTELVSWLSLIHI